MSHPQWTIPGAEGETIFGNTHMPREAARGVVVIAHGFKGYKDYGMFPCLAHQCAKAGFIAHRFNFSHSGMTNRIETFERPDLFERDTWNKQVFDLRAVVDAIGCGALEGGDLPCVLMGHSRGGVSVVLTAGRGRVAPAGIITAAAPSACNSMSEDEQKALLAAGSLVSPSSRTGQDLRVGSAFLQEQLDDPTGHDLLAVAQRVPCPALVIHGTDDPTVPAVCAGELAAALGGRADLRLVSGGNHVFNTPNPFPEHEDPGPELASVVEAMTEFAREVC